jgi:hypothetical protein
LYDDVLPGTWRRYPGTSAWTYNIKKIRIFSSDLLGGYIKPIQTKIKLAGSEFLRATAMKNFIFGDIIPCSLVKVNWRFAGTYRFIRKD